MILDQPIYFVFNAQDNHWSLSFTQELIDHLEKHPELQQELLSALMNTAKKALRK